ncbi:MAG: corrinoid protein, partial [Dehalococcoidia bacterium]
MANYDPLIEAIIAGEEREVEAQVNKALNEGSKPAEILANGLIAGMEVVGKRFRGGEMFLPEVLLSSEVMHKGLDIINPLLGTSEQKGMEKVVIGTVEGDIHDIGKRIVGFLLEGTGYEVIDLGVDVKDDTFIKAVEDNKPAILGLSALLTTTMPNMGRIIKTLQEKGLRNKVKVIVGGAPVSDQFAQSIGADGYAEEAGTAVEVVKQLLGR